MCGRYNIATSSDALIVFFEIERLLVAPEQLQPRFNVAPSQQVPVIRLGAAGRELTLMRWGLLPAWAKEDKTEFNLINARAETVAERPAFRTAFKSRRCLIPATGFYEWQVLPGGKQPHNIRRPDGGLFAFAGLWDRWHRDDRTIESCTIIVGSANPRVAPIHARMPVILAPAEFPQWLERTTTSTTLQSLLQPASEAFLETYPVSTRVNNVRNDDSALLDALA
ncbi:MAG: SOS response-associated peptidase [Thiotrichales bacterium]